MRFAIAREKEGIKEFSKRHDTLQEATIEAERLCKKERASFLILGIMGSVKIKTELLKWNWEKQILGEDKKGG